VLPGHEVDTEGVARDARYVVVKRE
jgi:hypothetical protein